LSAIKPGWIFHLAVWRTYSFQSDLQTMSDTSGPNVEAPIAPSGTTHQREILAIYLSHARRPLILAKAWMISSKFNARGLTLLVLFTENGREQNSYELACLRTQETGH
jgi:hypothetical protein